MGVAKKGRRSGGSSAPSRISDSRFASFETDPRFRLPSSKKTKTAIDKRFSHMLKSEDFISGAKVDRYGRKLKSDAGKKALQNLYRAEDEEEDKNSSDDEEETKAPGTESGDEDDEEDADEDVEAAGAGAQESEQKASKGRPYDPARDGGFSSSDSDSESDRDEEAVEELDDNTAASMQRFADEQAQVEEGDVTKRIAIVNLDWDHIKSHDLMALFTSFLPAAGKGKIERVSVYPSEFGKERMQREELEGPPRELFANSKKNRVDLDEEEDSDSDVENEKIKQELLQEEDDKDFDSDALRAYQLDRLRYYYAVMVCSDPATAHTIYEATDGTEYLSSSNFIDLRFIPDDVTFDDEPRDECTSVLEGYEPVEFVTNALQSSKVKLTWDIHPEEAARKQSMQKAFSGSRADMQENDLRAYLASDTEDEAGSPDEGDEGLSKKELAKKKLREALGLGDESATKSSKDGPVGDMEITFTSALMEGPKKAKKVEEEETTIEKYARKERERKQRKKEQSLAKRNDAQSDGSADEAPAEPTEDLGFNDPFFTTEEPTVSKSQIRKEDRLKKREAREAEEAENAASKAKLKRIMDDGAEEDGMSRFQHFDMKDIIRAEKDKLKKPKYRKKRGKDDEDASANLQEGKDLRLDDRFSSLFENHEYAIDTSNPSYTRTEALKKMLDDGRKRKTRERDDGAEPETSSKKNKKAKKEKRDNDVDLGSLVASVKQKAKKRSKV